MSFSTGDFSEWSLLAEGGEAEVFRARQASLDRLVGIKRLKLASIGDEGEVRRFEREAKLCASLSHPSLVQIFDYGHDAKFYYLVMEYVEGVDLGKLSGMAEPMKVNLARQMTEAVDFIHRQGVFHRDLKPENFMVDKSGRVKLLDLGMARVHMDPVSGHRPPTGGVLKGTLAYMPPERFQGRGFQNAASEYYSLALVVLELFAGKRLFSGKSMDEILSLIQTGIPLADISEVPEAVKSLLAPFLHPDPDRRPRNLVTLRRGLKGMESGTLMYAREKEALETVIHREQKAWLWTMVRGLERSGRMEDAFSRLRELLEVDPQDAEAQAKFQELGMNLNEPVPPPPPRRSRLRLALAGSLAVLAAASCGIFYLQWRPETEDLGRDLMMRELNLLSRESESGENQAMAGSQGKRPAFRPYGVLIVTGLPKGYGVKVNRVRYAPAEEIHLPAARHLLEIEDDRHRPVRSDTVFVGGGEPTVYEFAKKVRQP